MTRVLLTFVSLAVILQGGTMRACQLQKLVGAENEERSLPAEVAPAPSKIVASPLSCGVQGGDATPCACEYRKGLGQPERPVSIEQPAFVRLAPICDFCSMISPIVLGAAVNSASTPAPPNAYRSLPLLI